MSSRLIKLSKDGKPHDRSFDRSSELKLSRLRPNSSSGNMFMTEVMDGSLAVVVDDDMVNEGKLSSFM